MVSHPSLLAACRQWGLSPWLISCVSHLYDMAATTLDIEADPVNITMGVLQEDHLFPCLFNIYMDWEMDAIPKDSGIKFGKLKVNYLVFTGDVVIMASTRRCRQP